MTTSHRGSDVAMPMQKLGNKSCSDPQLDDSKELLSAVKEENKV